METLSLVFSISMVMWILSEVIYKQTLKSGSGDKKDKDKSTLNMLWIVFLLSIAAAVTISYRSKFPIVESIWIKYLGEFLILAGIVLRFIIIRTLGKYFTVDVTIKQDHTIKKEGFYSLIRHPSYSASLLTFLGLGIYLNNWISLILAFIPPLLAFGYRIKVEEQALIEQFGEEYMEYMKSTKRIIPFVY
ncbi:isoprenylcysteine carboxylmethyltransferase family protein [Chryseobacterium sp.]|uniref:methyltransferase family protein n=1 Tax=Chryseobacterium sp. TaxID=1871047 RepID=UPI0025BFA224|nr:isoprenylcysteine carboxylmethyltransferase family protein [Chryseobacterium sp.]